MRNRDFLLSFMRASIYGESLETNEYHLSSNDNTTCVPTLKSSRFFYCFLEFLFTKIFAICIQGVSSNPDKLLIIPVEGRRKS